CLDNLVDLLAHFPIRFGHSFYGREAFLFELCLGGICFPLFDERAHCRLFLFREGVAALRCSSFLSCFHVSIRLSCVGCLVSWSQHSDGLFSLLSLRPRGKQL